MRSFAIGIAVAVVLATCVVACGGDGGNESEAAAHPLTLSQRVVNESDAPDSKPDPVETQQTAHTLEDLRGWHYGGAPEIDPRKLEELGFIAAIHDTRFFPKKPGGPHRRDVPHVRTLLGQFKSKEAAVKAIDLLYEAALKPCPGKCAMSFEKIDVSGVPDAKGVRRYVTAERLKELHDPGEPTDSYTIVFADGPYTYNVELFGRPGEVSQEQLEEIVRKLHDRVEGAPPPGAP
jgi:hypothetical protein